MAMNGKSGRFNSGAWVRRVFASNLPKSVKNGAAWLAPFMHPAAGGMWGAVDPYEKFNQETCDYDECEALFERVGVSRTALYETRKALKKAGFLAVLPMGEVGDLTRRKQIYLQGKYPEEDGIQIIDALARHALGNPLTRGHSYHKWRVKDVKAAQKAWSRTGGRPLFFGPRPAPPELPAGPHDPGTRTEESDIPDLEIQPNGSPIYREKESHQEKVKRDGGSTHTRATQPKDDPEDPPPPVKKSEWTPEELEVVATSLKCAVKGATGSVLKTQYVLDVVEIVAEGLAGGLPAADVFFLEKVRRLTSPRRDGRPRRFQEEWKAFWRKDATECDEYGQPKWHWAPEMTQGITGKTYRHPLAAPDHTPEVPGLGHVEATPEEILKMQWEMEAVEDPSQWTGKRVAHIVGCLMYPRLGNWIREQNTAMLSKHGPSLHAVWGQWRKKVEAKDKSASSTIDRYFLETYGSYGVKR